ncbi:HTTM domain-containing protein [uncultured Aquimarina sp.]|uniref:HTTM domain-containing protein n=1 Tax=uncultured Aquimarina sp. TaxID=575652 RepID=UPI0026388EAB|nr:HTTM domain-containing protein [uncultured Aquimarina sp.]
MKFQLNEYFKKNTEAAPLVVFRIFFGLMMLISIIRFWSYGWIDKLYIQPTFFFSYYGFDFIKPIGNYTYVIFLLCAISAVFVMIGYKYRLAIIVFFLSFTYIELMDKTTYLNHYYFISILSFLLIFLPANSYYSLDAKLKGVSFQKIPSWTIDVIKLLLGIVYFYAGLAKLNSDWLVKAMPLKIWLPSKYDIPLIGDLMQEQWVHYAFSYTGAIYDLTIPFLLLFRKTRIFAFIMVVVFHMLTRVLFPIGMFPYVMIVSALIFFDGNIHHKILQFISRICNIKKIGFDTNRTLIIRSLRTKIIVSIMGVFFVIQLLLPFRYMLYPGELFWTEEGYRFSWRVMLMEKAGYANFKIVDQKTGKRFYVDNDDFLTPFQQKQMATQPDFILEYANYLKKHFEKQGHQNVQVFVESYVALNGRLSSQYIDPKVDLGKQKESFKHKTWIIPFKDEIKGL